MIDPYRADLPPVTATAAERRARVWLFEQKLPADEQSVILVQERQRAQARAGIVLLIVAAALVAGAVAAFVTDVRPSLLSIVVPFVALTPAISLTAVVVAWRRSDRTVAGWFRPRLAPLSSPSVRDLLGPTAPRRAAALVAVLMVGAGTIGILGGARVALTIAATVLAVSAGAWLLVEFARLRRVVAGDAASYEIDNRFRGEQAKTGVESLQLLFPLINVVAISASQAGTSEPGVVLVAYALSPIAAVGSWLVVRSVRPRTPADPPPVGWATPTRATR